MKPAVRCWRQMMVCWLLLMSSLPCMAVAWAQAGQLPSLSDYGFKRRTIRIDDHALLAEVADDDAGRAQGLMYRRMLPESHAMLFVFEQPAMQCMWMRNTYLPLSVGFFDAQRRLINTEDMLPQTETQHCSKRPALYAVETPRGWFKTKRLVEGARLVVD